MRTLNDQALNDLVLNDLVRGDGAVAAAAVLAAVFIWAGASKLRDRAQTAEDFGSLGLSGAERLAVLVPLSELVVAGLLLATPAWGGIAASALLIGFSTVLVRVLNRPEGAPGTAYCACFGGTSRSPVSPRHLMRNLILVALALWAAAFSGTVTTVV